MPPITRRKSNLSVLAEYINAKSFTHGGLGVPMIEESTLAGGSHFGNALLGEYESSQDRPILQQDTSANWTAGSEQHLTPTKTMLDVYAIMRGRLTQSECGPLYEEDFNYPPWKSTPEDSDPNFSRPILWKTFDHGSKQYKAQEFGENRHHEGIEVHTGMTFLEKLSQIGYLSINGKVTDPDSKAEVLNALNGVRGGSPPLPGFHDPLLSNVMTKAELEAYYIEFLLDVDNEDDLDRDNEGSPLQCRISPATFLEWATGARKKNALNMVEIEDEVVKRAWQEELKGEKPPGNPKPLQWSALRPQYDEESGSTFSPAYSVEEHPSPLMTPQGVDLNNVPHMFYHMLPEFNLTLARAAFYDGGIDLSTRLSSEAEIITEVYLAEVLGDGNLELGMHRIDAVTKSFKALKEERDMEVDKATMMLSLLETARETVSQLEEMTFARRQEISMPKRRARVSQLLGEWEENLRQQTARATNLTKLCKVQMDMLRGLTIQLVDELQELEGQIL